MACRWRVQLRATVILASFTIVAASCGSEAEDFAAADTLSSADSTITSTTSSSAAPEPESVAPESSATTTTTTTTMLPPQNPIPEGTFEIVPDGPYLEGQEVTLFAANTPRIDLYNSSPRLCARIDGDSEVCDPTWLRPFPVRSSGPDTQAVQISLSRRHFGPTGYRDCADSAVECRLLWQTEDRQLLTGPTLAYDGELDEPTVTLEVTVGDEPGMVTLLPTGLNLAQRAGDVFTARERDAIEDAVAVNGNIFDVDQLELTWEVGGFCGFGTGEHPIGSKGLVDPASWWWSTTLEPTVDGSAIGSVLGANCDWQAVERSLPGSDGDQPIDIHLDRHIYGNGGWLDCATSVCYVELVLSWSFKLTNGSKVGGDQLTARVLANVPDDWPSIRPSISIVEPGPYKQGQEVTVEVRHHRRTESDIAIGWCPGGDGYCMYKFVTPEDGVHRVTWKIPGSSSSCGLNRCYFEVDSEGEGLAPPAIVIVPVVE